MSNVVFQHLQTVLFNINAGILANTALSLLPFGIGKAYRRFLTEIIVIRPPFSSLKDVFVANLWVWAIADLLFLATTLA